MAELSDLQRVNYSLQMCHLISLNVILQCLWGALQASSHDITQMFQTVW